MKNVKILAGLMAFLLITPTFGRGEVTSNENGTLVSIDVTGAYLEDVLKLLSKQSGLNFVASEQVRDKKVTVYLEQVPIQAAIQTLLEAHHLRLQTVQGKNLYAITESPTPKVSTITRIFQLKYARVVPSAGEIFPTFGLSGSLIKEALQSSSSGSSGSNNNSSSSSGSFLGGGIGGGSSNDKSGLLSIIRSLLTEHGSVVSDPRTNSVIVTDIPERMPVIESTIAQLDVKPLQIYIEAEVLEVTLDTLRRLGLEYGTSAGVVGHYVLPTRSSSFPFLNGFTTTPGSVGSLLFSDANIVFKLLATESDVKFLARPRLLTLANEVAEIRIVSDAVTGVTSSSQSQTGTVTEIVERNTVGTILRVTPMINEGQYVTMVIEPEVSRVIQSASFSSFLDPNRRAARTTVMIPDGGTVMIAGLISTEDQQLARRIPGLGDIPILGIPFKRNETTRENTEIILFITPRIVKEDLDQSPHFDLNLPQEREQTPLHSKEQTLLETHHQRVLKERAIVETIDNLMR